MASGVQVNDECLKAYEEIKLGHKYKYIIFSMDQNDKQIIVEQAAPPQASYDEFVEKLKVVQGQGDCRYAVVDFDYVIDRKVGGDLESQSQKLSKLLFFIWCPETSRIKRKMLYASSKDAIKKKLQGIHVEIQGNDEQGIQYDTVLEKVLERKTF